MSGRRILTLNSGSSSLKFSVYEMNWNGEALVIHGNLERIGLGGDGHFSVSNQADEKLADESLPLADHRSALELLLKRLPALGADPIAAIGHRIVQGGPHHLGPERVTATLVEELRALCPLDPPHLPAALEAIEAGAKLGGNLPQVACFDTSFHRTLPPVAQRLPLPRSLTEDTGLMRYGFHGLSYEYIIGELESVAGATIAHGRVIVAHLGNGASMAAVRDGRSVETTMGFTPAGGLMMGSRPGDLDPGIFAFLLREGKLHPDAVNSFIYQECGFKGVSGRSSDVRDLMAVRTTDPQASEAIELFCHHARKALGSLIAVLDGVDTVVFTGGIGENAPAIRAAICAGMRHLGFELNSEANDRNDAIISSSSSRVSVRVMKTNEELVIARHTARLVFPNAPTP